MSQYDPYVNFVGELPDILGTNGMELSPHDPQRQQGQVQQPIPPSSSIPMNSENFCLDLTRVPNRFKPILMTQARSV